MAAINKADRASDSPGRVSQNAPASKSLSAAVWEHLEGQPGFSDAIAEGEAQIAAGRSVKLREVQRRR